MTFRQLLATIIEAQSRERVAEEARYDPKHRSSDPWKRDEADSLIRSAESEFDQEIDWSML